MPLHDICCALCLHALLSVPDQLPTAFAMSNTLTLGFKTLLLVHYRWANMFVPPAAGKLSNIASGGAFARTPKMALTEGPQRTTVHRYVSVSRAPEPNDLWWESTLYGGWPIIRRRILAWFFYFALLAASFAVQVTYLASMASALCQLRFVIVIRELMLRDRIVQHSRGLILCLFSSPLANIPLLHAMHG